VSAQHGTAPRAIGRTGSSPPGTPPGSPLIAIGWVAALIGMLFFVIEAKAESSAVEVTGVGLFYGGLMIVAVSRGNFFANGLTQFFVWALTLGLVAGVIAWYSLSLYPRLPQSLGGGAVRCAILELDAASVTPATLRSLGGKPADVGERTVRTGRVDVVFTRGERLHVRAAGQSQLHELRSGVVRAVVDCP